MALATCHDESACRKPENQYNGKSVIWSYFSRAPPNDIFENAATFPRIKYVSRVVAVGSGMGVVCTDVCSEGNCPKAKMSSQSRILANTCYFFVLTKLRGTRRYHHYYLV